MDPTAIDDFCADARAGSGSYEWDWRDHSRVGHGGENDCHWTLDFTRTAGPMTPDGVAQVVESSISASRARPADDYCSFRASAASFLGVAPDRIVPTVGATGAIRLSIDATVTAGDEVLVARPTYAEYEREVRLQGATPTFVDDTTLCTVDPAPYALVIVPAPNNPTGTLPDEHALEALLDRCRRIETPVLVDETFMAFADRASVAGHEAAIVVRSPSTTFGLPGLRAGFAVASGADLDRIDAGRMPWGIGQPAAAVFEHCFDRPEFVRTVRRLVASERERIRGALPATVEATDSEAPFLLLELPDSAAVNRLLEVGFDRGVAIRDARTFRGLDAHVRVAIREPTANDELIETIDAAMG